MKNREIQKLEVEKTHVLRENDILKDETKNMTNAIRRLEEDLSFQYKEISKMQDEMKGKKRENQRVCMHV